MVWSLGCRLLLPRCPIQRTRYRACRATQGHAAYERVDVPLVGFGVEQGLVGVNGHPSERLVDQLLRGFIRALTECNDRALLGGAFGHAAFQQVQRLQRLQTTGRQTYNPEGVGQGVWHAAHESRPDVSRRVTTGLALVAQDVAHRAGVGCGHAARCLPCGHAATQASHFSRVSSSLSRAESRTGAAHQTTRCQATGQTLNHVRQRLHAHTTDEVGCRPEPVHVAPVVHCPLLLRPARGQGGI